MTSGRDKRNCIFYTKQYLRCPSSTSNCQMLWTQVATNSLMSLSARVLLWKCYSRTRSFLAISYGKCPFLLIQQQYQSKNSLLLMNISSGIIPTETSNCSINQYSSFQQRIQMLEIQSSQLRQKCKVSEMFNLTLRQALLNMSTKNKSNHEFVTKLHQICKEAQKLIFSHQTLEELRKSYEEKLVKKDEEQKLHAIFLENKYREEFKNFKQKTQFQAQQLLSQQRQKMMLEVKEYLQRCKQKQKKKSQNLKENTQNSSSKYSSHRRKSSSSSIKSKMLSSPINNLQSSQRQISRSDLHSQHSYLRSSVRVHGKIATDLLCDNCNKVFSPNQFVSHINRCKPQQFSIGRFDKKNNQLKKNELMDQLLHRKMQIDQQLKRLSLKNDRSQNRQALQTEMEEIVLIMQKGGQLSTENIQEILENSTATFSHPKVGQNKKDIIIKRFVR